ncbi:MAG: N-formylglutamate amidohydrolase [Roseivirga sp.]|jgi:predicted N-formylglutamate amidohydrolase|uniref:N-formylglutamate amidohydrolase n=1 Tax=Roseivirga sp. TaxID=1964215 RepID=UPI001B0B98B7|nr:N-formylglutamate amidohydrolase [Roseivirga sp.]MBO6497526.1 N-formylglutamate amidohydrolase [Roseivirga sp.]
MSRRSFLITCEHAGNFVPANYRYLFLGNEAVLDTHRGIDIGAGALAENLADSLKLPLYVNVVSRLLIDSNRSKFNPELYSEFSKTLDPVVKKFLMKKYYTAYRQQVYEWIKERARKTDSVVHLSIHTFTPVLKGEVRSADIGILYDEKREPEAKISKQLVNELGIFAPQFVTKHNYPYFGTADGFTTYLRKEFRPQNYSGIEIEVNNKHHSKPQMEEIKKALQSAVRSVMSEEAALC